MAKGHRNKHKWTAVIEPFGDYAIVQPYNSVLFHLNGCLSDYKYYANYIPMHFKNPCSKKLVLYLCYYVVALVT